MIVRAASDAAPTCAGADPREPAFLHDTVTVQDPLGTSGAAPRIGHETTQVLSLPLQACSEASPRRPPVPTGVDEKVTPVTVVVHGAPQLLALPGDRDAAFVQTPRSSESTVPSLHPPGVLGADLPHPCRRVSYDTMRPRSASRSSTSWKLRPYLCYTQTAWLMLAGGTRCRRSRDRRRCSPALSRAQRDPDKALPVYARRLFCCEPHVS